MKQKVTMVWSCEERGIGGVLRWVEEIEVLKKERLEDQGHLREIVLQDLEIIVLHEKMTWG